MKNAGLGTGMAGGIKVLWDQVLLTGGTSENSGWVRSQVRVAAATKLTRATWKHAARAVTRCERRSRSEA